MKLVKLTLLTGALCGLVATPGSATHRSIDVAVSPAVLILKSQGPARITVHANIAFTDVNHASVVLKVTTMGGTTTVIPAVPGDLFADDTGELVAKFDAKLVKNAVTPTQALLVFECNKWDGSTFSGAVTVRVR